MSRDRLSTVTAGILAVYVVGWMLRLALLESGPAAFDRTTSWVDSPVGRLALAGALAATAHHLLDGSRQVGSRLAGPGSERWEGLGARAAVRVGWWAVVVPGWVVLARPWLEGILR